MTVLWFFVRLQNVDAKRREQEARPKASIPAPVYLSMATSKMREHERKVAEKEARLAQQRARQRYIQVCQLKFGFTPDNRGARCPIQYTCCNIVQ